MSEWVTGTAERSRTAADAMVAEWTAAGTPSGRLAQHVFVSLDGASLFFHAQWTDDDEHLAWARARRTGVVGRVDTLVPDVERPGLTRTRLANSVVHDARRPAGFFGVSTMAADDAETVAVRTSGLLAAHVHLTSDGERAIVVTEWADTDPQEVALMGGVRVRPFMLYRSFVDDPF